MNAAFGTTLLSECCCKGTHVIASAGFLKFAIELVHKKFVA